MVEIPLESGGVTRVSEEDFEYLDTWLWRLTDKGYVYTSYFGRMMYLHVEVFKRMKIEQKDVIDHKDRDKLNNTRENLRSASYMQSAANRTQRILGKTSNFIGVSKLNRRYNKWLVRIAGMYYGPFATEMEAARIRDSFAKAYWGEFAVLNFPD